jgi:hypothetical protein
MGIYENSILQEKNKYVVDLLAEASKYGLNSDEDIALYKSILAEQRTDGLEYLAIVQKNRDTLLDASDWIVVKSFEAGVSVPSNWVTYRQALRDVPAQSGYPDSITWPIKPE